MKTFSIVVPVYYNELNLPDTVPQLLALEPALGGMRLELVFVDDGSGDRSLEVLREQQRLHPERITVVKLTRNFGSMSAILAGFTAARGDCVGMIAADLQDPPELFLEMVQQWRAGTKAVLAVRSDREESWSQKAFANTYYALIHLEVGDQRLTIDCRPSDAISLALRTKTPIYVAKKVLESSSVLQQMEEDKDQNLSNVSRDKWAEILEKMAPDDFKYKM